MESDQTPLLTTSEDINPKTITDFEACIQEARKPGPQQLAFAERLLPIAKSAPTPADKEHRIREAHYHIAKLKGPNQVSSAKALLELTKPKAIQDPAARTHWAFEGPHCASQVEAFKPAERLELADRAAKGAANERQQNASKDFRNSNAGLILMALGKSRGERAKEGIMKAFAVVGNTAAKSICRSGR